MKKQNNIITVVILSIISTVLTFFAPLAKETTEGLFNTYSDTVSLFSGVDSGLCVALTVISGICFVLLPCISLFSAAKKNVSVGSGISGIALLIMQIICTVQSQNYYDDSSLLGAFRSEISVMSVHPLAIVTMIVTLITVIMCFMTQAAETGLKNNENIDEQ